jgi:O-antigen ligase
MPHRSSQSDDPIKDAWVFWGFLGLLFWAPLPLGSNRVWAIGLLLVWVLVLMVGTVALWRDNLQEAFDRISRFWLPILLLALMVGLSWAQTYDWPASFIAAISPEAAKVQAQNSPMFFSLDVHQSRLMAALSFVYFCAFLVAVLAVRSSRRLEQLAQLLVWSGVFQAVAGAMLFSIGAHYWLFHVELIHSRVLGTYVYHNSAAAYLVMCLSIGIGLMLARLGQDSTLPATWKERLSLILTFLLSPKMRLRIMLVVMVIALVLTRSRMGNAAFFSAMLLVGLMTILLARRTAPTTIGLITSLVIIDLFVVGGWVGLEKVVQRVQETALTTEAGGREESVEARTEAGRMALGIVYDFPSMGTGGGSFYCAFLRYRSPRTGYIDHAHNDFVEVTTDFGLPGLAILGSLVALSLWTALRILAQRKSNLPRGVAFGVAMSIVALLIHSAVDFNLQIPANALTMVVILAMAWIARELPSPRGKRLTAAKGVA